MSVLRLIGSEVLSTFRQVVRSSSQVRPFSSSRVSFANTEGDAEGKVEEPQEADEEVERRTEDRNDPKDRTRVIPVETSIRYLASEAYQQTYQGEPVWRHYRRNHKGLYPPKKTRRTCIRKGRLSTGNPCPICRDEYLVLDHNNIELIKQFISPHTGQILSYQKTGVCQKKHLELMVAVERAKDHGLLTFDVPFRQYDYSEYYKNSNQ